MGDHPADGLSAHGLGGVSIGVSSPRFFQPSVAEGPVSMSRIADREGLLSLDGLHSRLIVEGRRSFTSGEGWCYQSQPNAPH